jgi:hypothetical protein
MMRKRVLLQTKCHGDLGRAHTLRRKAHQQAKYGQSPGMAERGKSMNSTILFHNS